MTFRKGHSVPKKWREKIGKYERSEAQKERCRKIGKLYGGKKRILKDKKCPVCGKIFRPYNSFQKFCSYPCFSKKRPKKGIYKKCEICGKKFYSKPSHSYQKYCSTKCQYKAQEIPEAKVGQLCKFCGKQYSVYRSEVKWRGSSFCSSKCFKAYKQDRLKRRKLVNWRGGKSLKKALWIVFSKYIRQRDDGVCISCGKKDDWRKMDAGHYVPKTAGLSLYFDERNVNCQCTACNRFRHGNLTQYALALQEKYGPNILTELDKARKTTRRMGVLEYQELIDFYKNKIKKNNFRL